MSDMQKELDGNVAKMFDRANLTPAELNSLENYFSNLASMCDSKLELLRFEKSARKDAQIIELESKLNDHKESHMR